MKHIKLNRISLKKHPTIKEQWLQNIIYEDPSILGLGELVARDKERIQARAGRLDLLLQDPVSNARFEVEIQLGATDESHIIRTLEYWDIERKRYPQYEHTAVIIAEDITSRFLNVITLFNGHIPLIALQVAAYEHPDGVSLSFTKVLDAVRLGLVDEDEEVAEPTDKKFWEDRSSKTVMEMVDRITELTHTFDSELKLSYNKGYIGFWLNGSAYNFAIIRPRRTYLTLEIKISQEEMQAAINEVLGENAELDIMDYDLRWERSRIRLTPDDLNKNHELLTRLLHEGYIRRK